MESETVVLMDPWEDWRDARCYPRKTIFHEMVRGKLFVLKSSFFDCGVDESFRAKALRHTDPARFKNHPSQYKFYSCFWVKHHKYGVLSFNRKLYKHLLKELRLLADVAHISYNNKTKKRKLLRKLKEKVVFEPLKGKRRVSFIAEYQQHLDDKSGKYLDFSIRNYANLPFIDSDSEEDD